MSAVPHTNHQEALLSCLDLEWGWAAFEELRGKGASILGVSKLGITPAKPLSCYTDPNNVMRTPNTLRTEGRSVDRE